jgi:hypothetical protein
MLPLTVDDFSNGVCALEGVFGIEVEIGDVANRFGVA